MELSDRAKTFRAAIAAFITEQRDIKLKDKNDPETSKKFEYENWLNETANTISGVQLTTHPLKATYPDAKIKETTSPFVKSHQLPTHKEVGSHMIKQDISDGTGNAALLGKFKFLTGIIIENMPLAHWCLENDADLLTAINSDPDIASQVNFGLKKTYRENAAPRSHTFAKQVYWLVGNEPSDNGHFQLLQPMFSSSLAHVVHADIQEARFGDDNKAARKARRNKDPCGLPYRDYRNLVARKLGGTKPQNISQLNSERGGVNYLLASLPPLWKQSRAPQVSDSHRFWNAFRWQPATKRLLHDLTSFLQSEPSANMATRRQREGMEQALGASLAAFADTIHATHEPGWTRGEACQLPTCLQLWLDPGRLDLPPRTNDPQAQQEDEAFRVTYHLGDWPDEIAGQFANWLNSQLHDAGLKTVGDTEYKHWARQAIIEAAWPVPMQRRAPAGDAS